MKIGFTGTQFGMTQHQKEQLRSYLQTHKPTEFHHGDCHGADFQAAVIADSLGITTISHPPEISTKRAYHQSTIVLPPHGYLTRNHHIVDATDLLIAAPRTMREQRRSGTWATYRYAKSINRTIILLIR